jgi:cytoskeletal protein CcmA (bactofilin family)
MPRTIEPETSNALSIITAGTLLKGDILAKGDFRLDGTLEGNFQSDGKLVVGQTGIINGHIHCDNANIIGTVNGNLTVGELLSLHATARVTGDILTNQLSIEPGAVFTGRCHMLDEVRSAESLQASEAAPANIN